MTPPGGETATSSIQRESRLVDPADTAEATAEERIWLLGEASDLLSSSLDFETTLTSLARLCVPRLADWCGVEIGGEDGTSQQLAVAHVDAGKVELAREYRRRFPPDPDAQRGVAHVLRTGETEHVEKIADEMFGEVARNAEHERLIRSLGLESYIIVPIALHGRILGALTLVHAESKRRYGPRDVKLAQELALRAAHAIEHARLYREANLARQQAEEAAQRLGLLAGLSQSLAPSLEPEIALRRLARFAVSNMADYSITYALDDDGTIRRVALAHADPDQQPLVEDLVRAGPPSLDDPYGAGAVLRTGEPVLATEITSEVLERGAQNAQHLDVLKKLVPRSSLIVPLTARSRTVGALAMATTDRSAKRYQEADLLLARELASRAALLVDNARLYSRAQQATRARDQMLSIVSHDLRSPLNTVVTACELLELDLPEDRRARTRGSIRRAARQMNRLLEDLLDVTRIVEGRLTLQREPVHPNSLLIEVVSMHAPIAEHGGVHLSKCATDQPAVVEGDWQRLSQALSNLVDNALKFTPEGGQVEVAATVDLDHVRIGVSDTGPGIPAEHIPHLFDRFWRAENAQRAGVGLGLSIARGIAEAHGGSIEVVNRPGGGTRFTMVLPRSLK